MCFSPLLFRIVVNQPWNSIGEKVLVIGTGASGIDIKEQLIGFAKSVTLSYRMNLPKVNPVKKTIGILNIF